MRFEYKAYRRSFRKEFANAHSVIPSREGVVIRLEDEEGRVGFGEIAPLVEFGTESLAYALSICAQLEGDSFQLGATDPLWKGTACVAHAVEAAAEMMEWSEERSIKVVPAWPICGLLGSGEWELGAEELVEFGFRAAKVKVGVGEGSEERRRVARLAERVEGELSLRLDGNGGLELREAVAWLELAAELGVEFIEQPMKRGEEAMMAKLAADFPTPIALDESVVSIDDLKRERDRQWAGFFVIKPLIGGGASALRTELSQGETSQLVFSSSLESRFGAATALRLALEFRSEESVALGFGGGRLFVKDGFGFDAEPFLQTTALPTIEELSALWSRI